MTLDPRFRVLIIAAVAIVLLPGLAGASGKDGGNRKPWYEQETVQEKLELTDDQVTSLAEVETTYGPRLAAMNQEKRTAYRSLVTSLDSDDLTQQEFEAMRARLEAAYGTHAATTGDRWQALRSVLTKQQWRNLPEAAPKALSLGQFGVAKRGGMYMGPSGPKPTSKSQK